jgi:tRNA-specific 2-thiouridylase
MKKAKGNVFVGISGGVDSSVAAALLKEQGYRVTGVFIKVWQPDFLPCTWRQERLDAQRVCARLDIPFLTFDFAQRYKQDVADYMIESYRAGRTPNPDVMCNKQIKFGAFLEEALARGADFIATGHHVRRKEMKGVVQLLAGKDASKDQSYFLWTLTQEQLEKSLFPIGEYQKSTVRKMAAQYDLPTAQKRDSQGICFLGKVNLKTFLEHYIPAAAGSVVNENGDVIGSHTGAAFYTIGQRHGFSVIGNGTVMVPHYIIAKDLVKNILVVSPDPAHTAAETMEPIRLESAHWIAGSLPKGKTSCRVRYRQKLVRCSLEETTDGKTLVSFSGAQPLCASGQSLVVYQGHVCLGGGVIA